jgi:acetylornithine/N-succinyldiaminopimelate aminotransferase
VCRAVGAVAGGRGGCAGGGLIQGLVVRIPAAEVVKAAMDCGLLLVPAGSQVVRFVPPLIVTPAEIDAALAMLASALQRLAASLGHSGAA